LKTEVLVWWCGWNDWLSGSCRGATVLPVQAWKSDVKLTSNYTRGTIFQIVNTKSSPLTPRERNP